jgi:segregation and condensation protein A
LGVRAATAAELFPPRDGLLQIDIDRFQGPFDLLLHLIRQQDIDVFDIPIARITAQFLKAVQSIGADQLDNAGEFLEMAAMLIRIKAQMLLPRHEDEEDEDPRAELVRRLLEYEQIREISSRLSGAEAERARRFSKGFVPPRPKQALVDTPLETTWDEVLHAALGLKMPEPRDRRHAVITRPVAMEDKIDLILATLTEAAQVEFSRLLAGIQGFGAKMHGVMTFLASLELTRRRRLFLRQIRPFSELWLYRREESEPEETPVDDGVEPMDAREEAEPNDASEDAEPMDAVAEHRADGEAREP